MADSAGYFAHMAGGRVEGEPLQHATRYLCAGVYLDDSFGQKVIAEFVEDDSRAVVPSFGFDLVPVIGHALRARRMRVVRDLTMTLVVLPALVLQWQAVLLALMMWAPVMYLPFVLRSPVRYLVLAVGPVWRNVSRVVDVAFWITVAVGVIFFVFLLLAVPGDPYEDPYWEPGFAESITGGVVTGKFVFVWALAFFSLPAVPLLYRYVVLLTLRTLHPGSRQPAPQAAGERVRATLDRVASAQRGNITLYSHQNPFLGSGGFAEPWARAWSIVLELDRAAGHPGQNGEDGRDHPVVDPVALHRHVHERLVAMRDGVPPHERIAGLTVDWHVVAQGECMQGPRPSDPGGTGPEFRGHPLIDDRTSLPFSLAGDRAVEAIINHPQADIRCYQRVTVGTQGQTIRKPSGEVLAPAEYQDLALSAFLYLAVEGRMLYAQFVMNAMPPIRRSFRIVDMLPSYTTGMIVRRVAREYGPQSVLDGLLSPVRLVRTLFGMAKEGLTPAGKPPGTFVLYDYGARMSVREEAAEPTFPTFMQTLDADKYTNLIERRINEAVLDHLQRCRVDVTAYREQAALVMNNPFIMNGGSISGSQIAVGGTGARITQQQQQTGSRGRTS